MNRLKQTASELVAYLNAPTLQMEPLDGPKFTAVAWLFLLNFLIVAAIAAVLFPALLVLEIEMPGSMSELFQRPVWQVLAIVVIVGPIMEELIFRGWISGNPRLLVLSGAIIAWIGGSYALTESGFSADASWPIIALIVVIAAASIFGLIRVWKKDVPGWYVGIFPIIFWLQALLFGFIHVFNYAGENPLALLPFVLPQLIGGLIWGYARIRYGWWSNIAMHMAYNLIATSGLLFMLVTGGELVSS